jgi:hypothetical protein
VHGIEETKVCRDFVGYISATQPVCNNAMPDRSAFQVAGHSTYIAHDTTVQTKPSR